MATSHGSSPSKIEVYESLYLISLATRQITDQLERLKSLKILARTVAEGQRLAAHELRAVIATAAVHSLADPELEDAGRYQAQRIRMETRLAQRKPKMKSIPK